MAQVQSVVTCPVCGVVELTQVEEHTSTGLRPGWRAWLVPGSQEHLDTCQAAAAEAVGAGSNWPE